ncbi:MAG: DUF1365 domain-containing protein [Hyphomonadaceae bacterium]
MNADQNDPAFQCVRARIYHQRQSGVKNAFSYDVDFILAPMNAQRPRFWPLFSRTGFAAASILDRDHGLDGRAGVDWARRTAQENGVSDAQSLDIWLLTQPRMFGFLFNPVSFWFMLDRAGALRCVLAEVNNTFGERCVYVCRRPDGGAIRAVDALYASKAMKVSPFQIDSGKYQFHFDWRANAIDVRIAFHDAEGGGMLAALSGVRKPMSRAAVALSLLRFPLGSLRVFALIVWQAAKLMWKGERYRRPERPNHPARVS